MANPTPWPEILQHAQQMTFVLNGACDGATHAQTIIARRWREKKSQGWRFASGRTANPAAAAFARALVDQFFTRPDSCTATGKLDGTNVGIDTDGELFGRRTAIAATNESYQKTPLADLRGRAAQITALRHAVASAAGIPELEELPLMLYGELCVNKLYDYESSYAEGSFKKWQIFGVAIAVKQGGYNDGEIDDDGVAAHMTRTLVGAGFRARCGDTIVLSMCNKLRAIVDEVNMLEPKREPLICVKEMGSGSIVQVVSQALKWMLEMRGEGLVLTFPEFGARSGTFKLTKWKCAHEPQQRNIDELTKLLRRLSDVGDFPPSVHFLLPAGVVEMLQRMHAVATAGSSSPFKKGNQAAEGAKDQVGSGATQSAAQDATVEEAIVSALTKFDTPDVYFDRDERKKLTDMLLAEVLTDLNAEGKVKKMVTGAVMEMLGQEYGRWKRGRDAAAA
jgi:hypothetical protein